MEKPGGGSLGHKDKEIKHSVLLVLSLSLWLHSYYPRVTQHDLTQSSEFLDTDKQFIKQPHVLRSLGQLKKNTPARYEDYIYPSIREELPRELNSYFFFGFSQNMVMKRQLWKNEYSLLLWKIRVQVPAPIQSSSWVSVTYAPRNGTCIYIHTHRYMHVQRKENILAKKTILEPVDIRVL